LSNIKAVIFDMDGLLLDTEIIARSTFIAACRECGFEPDLKVYNQCIGTTYKKTEEILKKGYGKSFDYESVSKIWGRKFDKQVENEPVPLKMGALSLVQYLEDRRMKMAVVTSTRRSIAFKELTNAGLLQFFKLVIGGDEITHGKPDPDIYLKACSELQEEPPGCLALEDSDNGVRAAHSANLTVIQVPDLVEPSIEVMELGHQIVKSLLAVEKMFKESS
jgi:HAD superfamily hydrolase (TIGR01509 family)